MWTITSKRTMGKGDSIIRAIILAAGRGIRLGPMTTDVPKTLLKSDNKTVLEHQMKNLKNAGIDKVTMVVGFKADAIKRFCTEHSWDVDFVCNKDYANSGNFFSLWLARGRFEDGFVCLNSDVLFNSEILKDLLGCGGDICAAVDPNAARELMKVKLRGEKITEINKTMQAEDAYWVGMVKFSQGGVGQLLSVLKSIPKDQLRTMIFSKGVQKLVDGGYVVRASDTRRRPWVNINFAEDLMEARARRW